jgi:hypothetical protein
MANDGGKGSSESLNLTITDIMRFLDDDSHRPSPRDGERLRPFLEEKLGDFAELWLKRGFKTGHKTAFAKYEKNDKFPKTIRLKVDKGSKRSKVAPNHERALDLKSKL